jgi:hypothetical protein
MAFYIPSAARMTEGWGESKAAGGLSVKKGNSCCRDQSITCLMQNPSFSRVPSPAVPHPREATQSQATWDVWGLSSSQTTDPGVALKSEQFVCAVFDGPVRTLAAVTDVHVAVALAVWNQV